MEMTPERSLSVIQNAAVIFEGTVVSLDQPEQPEQNADYAAPIPQNPLYAKARLKINESYKGGAPDERYDAYIETMTDCGMPLQLGDTGLFLLTRQGDILVQADMCSDPLPEHWNDLKGGKFKG